MDGARHDDDADPDVWLSRSRGDVYDRDWPEYQVAMVVVNRPSPSCVLIPGQGERVFNQGLVSARRRGEIGMRSFGSHSCRLIEISVVLHLTSKRDSSLGHKSIYPRACITHRRLAPAIH